MSLTEKIPFLDLVTPHQQLEPELTAVFQQVLRTAGFVGGSLVENFENEFAAFCDAKYCVGVANGTDAVRFALMAAGVQQGDIVVTVPHTFIATTEAISQAGARPDFVDIDEQTYSMDVAKLREYLERECYVDRETGKPYHRKYRAPVTAVVPVHIYGQCADMDPILEVARRYNLIVVEDACQATARSTSHRKKIAGRRRARWATPQRLVFIPERILVLVEKRVRSRLTAQKWCVRCVCCAITAKSGSITTTSKDTTAG